MAKGKNKSRKRQRWRNQNKEPFFTTTPKQTDSDLFFIDTQPEVKLTRKQKKEKAKNRVLHAARNLQPRDDEVNTNRKRKLAVQERDFINRITKKRKLSEEKTEKSEYFDLWDDDALTDPEEKDKPYLKVLRAQKKSKKTKPVDKPADIPAVLIPDAGISYNPDEEAHQDLLRRAVAEQIVKKKEYDLVMDTLAKSKGKFKETQIGVFGEEASSDESSEEKVNQRIIARKTQVQRNKEKRHKEYLREIRKKKKEKEHLKETVGDAIQEHEEKQEEIEERKVLRDEVKRHKAKLTKKLGKEKFVEGDIEVLLTDQLPSSLRTLDPASDLLEDRFKSLQRRNIIEVRSEKPYHRRYGLKTRTNIRYREYTLEQEKKYLNQN